MALPPPPPRPRPAWMYLSGLIIAVAGIIKLRQGAGLFGATETHCYQLVRTNTQLTGARAIDCFTVSLSTGKFTKAFASPSFSPEAATIMEAEGWEEPEEGGPGFAIPGLWDGHGHLLQYGEFLNSVDLFGASSMDEARERVRDYVQKNPGVGSSEGWVRGVGWDQMALGRMPAAVSLSVGWLVDWMDGRCLSS